MGTNEDFKDALKAIQAVMTKHDKTCLVTARILDGEGTLQCALALGHEGEHMCMYTPHNAYLRRVAERIFEKVCIRDGAVSWKGTESNPLQGWDDSIEVLRELIGVVLRIEREGPEPDTYFYRSGRSKA